MSNQHQTYLGQRRQCGKLYLPDCPAPDDESGERREEYSDTLHVRRPPVSVVSSPTPLVMEEPCPLRSFVC